MTGDLSLLERELGHVFRDRELLERALTHKSRVHEVPGNALVKDALGNEVPVNGTSRDNEQLEFLGDAILGFVVSECLVRRHGSFPEGRLSKLKAHLVSATR